MKKLYTVISVLAILLLIVGVVKWRSDIGKSNWARIC